MVGLWVEQLVRGGIQGPYCSDTTVKHYCGPELNAVRHVTLLFSLNTRINCRNNEDILITICNDG